MYDPAQGAAIVLRCCHPADESRAALFHVGSDGEAPEPYTPLLKLVQKTDW